MHPGLLIGRLVETLIVETLLSLPLSGRLLHDFSLDVVEPQLQALLEVVDATLPIVRLLALSTLLAADQLTDDEHVDLHVDLASTLEVEHVVVICHEAQLGGLSVLTALLHHLGEGVAHDGNQHVQEHNLREQCGEDEKDVAQIIEWVALKGIE